MGHYHQARMEALCKQADLDITVIELYRREKMRFWKPSGVRNFKNITIWSGEANGLIEPLVGWLVLMAVLKIKPAVLIIPGYNQLSSFWALLAGRLSGSKCVLYSVTHALDKKRHFLAEALKKQLLSLFDAVFVAGGRAKAYMHQLGRPPETVFTIGNVVDNQYFETGCQKVRQRADSERQALKLPKNYFLYTGRLAKEKNLLVLLRAFAQYRMRSQSLGWSLVLVGSGPEETGLKNFAKEQRIADISFVPFQQPETLVAYYALAGAFVLPSASETWGLVANEAAACQLPLLLSERCGCLPELLKNGENGFAFDPFNEKELAGAMEKLTQNPAAVSTFGEASHQLAQKLTLHQYAQRVSAGVQQIISRKAI